MCDLTTCDENATRTDAVREWHQRKISNRNSNRANNEQEEIPTSDKNATRTEAAREWQKRRESDSNGKSAIETETAQSTHKKKKRGARHRKRMAGAARE